MARSPVAAPIPDLDALSAVTPVSRETFERLSVYASLLVKWQASQNLVAPNTIAALWHRHLADSLQAWALRPDVRRWADLGSGAGFPGLVTAIALADQPGGMVHLVESNSGKAAFLRTVARETGAPVTVHVGRIETVVPSLAGAGIEAVSARALAALDVLLAWSEPLLAAGAVALFHKGQQFESEWRAASQIWDIDLIHHPSMVDAGGVVVEIRRATRTISRLDGGEKR
jgi:16S rRNA (guanine527-N7)-methyltransferase